MGYQEEFTSGNDQEGAYVCHLTIAAPTLTMQAGGPGGYRPPTPGTHGNPVLASAPVLERVTQATEGLEERAGWEVLKRLGQSLARLLTNAPALTAALLLPTNSRDDDGYKSEWDLSKLTQTPTNKDRARLDYLEAERERRSLSEAEADELASLLAIVRKVFVGGRGGLPVYYAQRAEEALLHQLVPDFRGVHLAGPRGEATGEFDGINRAEKLFIEDKSAQGLDKVNPRTGLKHQTPAAWARKHIFEKTVNRIEALRNASYTYPTPNGPPAVPSIEQIRGFQKLRFRVDADTPEIRRAVKDEIQNLQTTYLGWRFTAQYGN